MRQEVAVVHEYIRDIDNSVPPRGGTMSQPSTAGKCQRVSNKNVSGIPRSRKRVSKEYHAPS